MNIDLYKQHIKEKIDNVETINTRIDLLTIEIQFITNKLRTTKYRNNKDYRVKALQISYLAECLTHLTRSF